MLTSVCWGVAERTATGDCLIECRARRMVRCPLGWRNSSAGRTLGKRGLAAFTLPDSERYFPHTRRLRGDGDAGAGRGLACGVGVVLLDKRPK